MKSVPQNNVTWKCFQKTDPTNWQNEGGPWHIKTLTYCPYKEVLLPIGQLFDIILAMAIMWRSFYYSWVCKYIGFIQWEVKQLKAFSDWTVFFWGDEKVEWFKTLNFLQSERCCPRIEFALSSLHLLDACIIVLRAEKCLVVIGSIGGWRNSGMVYGAKRPSKRQVLSRIETASCSFHLLLFFNGHYFVHLKVLLEYSQISDMAVA